MHLICVLWECSTVCCGRVSWFVVGIFKFCGNLSYDVGISFVVWIAFLMCGCFVCSVDYFRCMWVSCAVCELLFLVWITFQG